MLDLSRRDIIILGSTAAATVLFTKPQLRQADTKSAQALLNKFTSGKEIAVGKIKLEIPEIAENGNTVPISFSVDSPMTKDDYVKRVIIIAEDNPRPEVATFNFTPLSGVAKASSRMRLAKTQTVIAVAEISDGSFHMAKTKVKVTIGGCGSE